VNPSKYWINKHNTTFLRIRWNSTTAYAIYKIIKSLKSKNSTLYDEISIKMLKLRPFYYFPLTYICNKFLPSVLFPETPKYATIKTVYQKAHKLLTTIYRPISLLTSFTKIFEKQNYSTLYKRICTNNLLVKEQYVFRIDSSTEAAFYIVINEILKAMNNIFSVSGTFCELEKAFDWVNQGIVVDKLQFCGIVLKY
jgi:hypothetical protein